VEEEIDAFIRYIAVERGLSENYQVSTRRSLAEFAQWCLRRHSLESARVVTIDHITEYLGDRKRAGLAAASIKLIVVALKIFFRFLLGKKLVRRDPTETLSLPRIERYLPETLNEIQVEQLLEAIDTTVRLGLRDRAMVELLYASGLRISELANARLENFNAEDRILRVIGKGNKTRLVPVGRKACEALAAYLSGERPNWWAAAPATKFSFPPAEQNDDGARLADCEKTRQKIRLGSECLPASFTTQFCHAFARQWR
jgi:integrase/recombinase XerD